MNIIIDGQPTGTLEASAATFGDIMKALADVRRDPGIGITRVRLNGTDITGRDWRDFVGLPADRIESLEIGTGDVANIARDMLTSLEDFSGRLITELGQTAELLRSGNEERAATLYARAIDGMTLLRHTAEMTFRHLKPVGPVNGNGSHHHLFDRLPGLLDELIAVQEGADWVLLADLIEYELIPLFEDHQRLFHEWQSGAAGGALN
ncbi:MAG: hypothetical protein FJY67_02755 [Calditrichaeota bacterium]|nr:hypothetical protein [Calditrichota bacterium]